LAVGVLEIESLSTDPITAIALRRRCTVALRKTASDFLRQAVSQSIAEREKET
jgi:hypothetical protein